VSARPAIGAAGVTLVLGLAGCGGGDGGGTAPAPTGAGGPSATSDAWFVEEAEVRGLTFEHRSGAGERLLFPEITCGGAALFDADGDGDLDAYLVQAGSVTEPAERRPPNRLYRNRGDGTFEDVTEASGAGDRGYGMGVATGDFDNDGDVDLYVTNVGPNALLRNDGDSTFTDVSAAAGVDDDGWGSSAAFVDIDADGDLDLYVVNYINWRVAGERECFHTSGQRDYCAPNNYEAPAEDVLYRNEGDGTFTDVSAESGIRAAFGNGLGVVCGDLDGDGAADVYVANDGMRNQMWMNQGDGTFRDEAMSAGTALDLDGTLKAGMGVDAIDVDDDGDLDLLVVNLGTETDSFYRNEGTYFSEESSTIGLAAVTKLFTRFGTAFRDFDHDGRLDLYQANGRVRRQAQSWADDPFAEPNVLMRGTAEGRFEEVRPRGGTDDPLVATSRAAAFGDVDGDGAVDVLVVNRDGPAHLLRNVRGDRGHWIMLRLIDEHGRDAIGATVTMRLGAARRITRDVRTAFSYCAASDPRIHVGLGTHQGVSDVSVRWPDGAVEAFGDLAGDAVRTLRRGAGTPAGG
jgi:hypothetical protein